MKTQDDTFLLTTRLAFSFNGFVSYWCNFMRGCKKVLNDILQIVKLNCTMCSVEV